MATRQRTGRFIRKGGRKKSRVRVGPRAFILFLIAVLVTGIVAISLDLKFEAWERAYDIERAKQ